MGQDEDVLFRLLEADPGISQQSSRFQAIGEWQTKRLQLVRSLTDASSDLRHIQDLRDAHLIDTSANPNWFARIFFGIAAILRVRVPCSDESDIINAIHLRKRERLALSYMNRCNAVLCAHLNSHPDRRRPW